MPKRTDRASIHNASENQSMIAKTALIVDDSRLAQFVLKKMLTAEQFHVETSDSAEHALSYLAGTQPDIIFLDHSMPGMNGLEALELMKANPLTHDIPVMMYTSQEDRAYMDKAVRLGAIDVLPKELKKEQLQQALHRIDQFETPTPEPQTIEPTDRFSEAINEVASQGEVLEQIVYDAEEALKYETWQQKSQQRFDKFKSRTDKNLTKLNSKIDTLSQTQERYENNGQNFWTNLFWFALYTTTVIIFSVLYLQQKDNIEELTAAINQQAFIQEELVQAQAARPINTTTSNPQISSNQTAINSQPIQENNTTPPPRPVQVDTNETSITPRDLADLAEILNTNNEIPFGLGKFLLGSEAINSLEQIIEPLRAGNYKGSIDIVAHDGSFCATINSAGLYVLPPETSLLYQCEILEPSIDITEVASDAFISLTEEINQASDNISINIQLAGNSNAIEEYPAGDENQVTAGEWNNAALTNRRVTFNFSPTE